MRIINHVFSIGDSWNDMRLALERVFSHESASKSLAETKQYELSNEMRYTLTISLRAYVSVIFDFVFLQHN